MAFEIPANYSSVISLIKHKGSDPEGSSPLAKMKEWQRAGMPDGLDAIEFCLSGLLQRFSFLDLWEQVDPLLKATGDVETIYTELFGLKYFNDKRILKNIRYPKEYPGSAPFDCLIDLDGIQVAVDIKPMCGSGTRWIDEIIRPLASEWTEKHHLGEFEIEIKYEGPISRQAISKDRVRILSIAEACLGGCRVMPVNIEFDVENDVDGLIPGDPAIKTSTVVNVELRKNSGMTVSGGSTPSYSHTKILSKTLYKHVSEKGKRSKDNGCPYYLIAYVRPPAWGDSDMQIHSFGDAFQQAGILSGGFPGYEYWIGALVIDWTSSPDCGLGILHTANNSNIPKTLNANLLC